MNPDNTIDLFSSVSDDLRTARREAAAAVDRAEALQALLTKFDSLASQRNTLYLSPEIWLSGHDRR